VSVYRNLDFFDSCMISFNFSSLIASHMEEYLPITSIDTLFVINCVMCNKRDQNFSE